MQNVCLILLKRQRQTQNTDNITKLDVQAFAILLKLYNFLTCAAEIFGKRAAKSTIYKKGFTKD